MNKKNLILGGVLIILVVFAYLYSVPFKDWRENSGRPDNFLAGLDMARADKIEITKFGNVTVLEKIGDRWRIGGTKEFYIKDDLAASLASGLNNAVAASVEIAGENKDNKIDFQTDDTTGTKVKISQGGTVLADFIIGKAGGNYMSAYISKSDEDKTYLVGANISTLFNRSDWYDRAIFSSDKDTITKIRFQYPGREFTIEKIDGSWAGVLPYKFSVAGDKADKILAIMSGLTAAGIPPQTFDGTGLEKNLIIVQATGDGIDNTIMVGDAKPDAEGDSALYFAKRGSSDNIYLITEEQRDELDKQIRDLR